MSRNNAKAIELSVRSGRALLRSGIALENLDATTPSRLDGHLQVARIASIDARSEGVRVGDTTIVIVDKVQSLWIYALSVVRTPSDGKTWPIYTLHHYYALRLVGCGLANEARAFSERLRPETRLLSRDDWFDISNSRVKAADIDQFILGHELGHVAYRAGGAAIQTLLQTVHACADDLTRLLRVTFTGDRSLLTASEQDPRYEDIVQSMTDYLNRFIFNEYADDIRKYERDLLARADVRTLQARRHRYHAFADIFETVDFIEESFCDLYALEFRLIGAEDSPSRAAEIVMDAWQHLHAMFALTALDSLARDRQVAARISNELRSLLKGVDVASMTEAEIHNLYRKTEDIEASRNSDRALLFYQIAMLKAVYRRVVFMNYVARHPQLAKPQLLRALEEEGEKLEGQFIGACATLRFNGIRLEVEHKAGFNDTLEPAGRADLDRIWADLIVRVPGMDQADADDPLDSDGPVSIFDFRPRCRCDFCGADATTARLTVTSGRASICDQCTLTAERAFAALPEGQPRRPIVEWGILSPLPSEPVKRADPAAPHCRFCELAPAPGEPLISLEKDSMICGICAEAVTKIVRMESPGSDPTYFAQAKESLERMMTLAQDPDSPVVRKNLSAVADSMKARYERELNPTFPGREIWRLFTEPTLEPAIPLNS